MESLWLKLVREPGTAPEDRAGQVAAHLVAVVHGRDDLPEEMAGVTLAEPLPLTDVVIQVTPAGILHDDHDLAAVLKHWGTAKQDIRPHQSTLLPNWGPLVSPWT